MRGFDFLSKIDQDDGCILMFTTTENLRILSRSAFWIMDGTFKTTPNLFRQLYTIHGRIGTNIGDPIIPLVYTMMTSKSEEYYRILFQELIEKAHIDEIDLNPPVIITDFELAAMNKMNLKQIEFNHPIVGLHIRRTDKITEAQFHHIDEYMAYVEDFYNKIDFINERNSVKSKVKRRVFLSTDEMNVWKNEIIPYQGKGYQFIGDINHSKTASIKTRNMNDSNEDLLIDLFMLSECDFIVCTFSSNFCRSALQLMYLRNPNAQYRSLDTPYFFWGQSHHGFKVIVGHKAQNKEEWNFHQSDILGISNYLQNGYNIGDLNGSNENAKYPKFKVEEYVQDIDFKGLD